MLPDFLRVVYGRVYPRTLKVLVSMLLAYLSSHIQHIYYLPLLNS